MSIGIMRAGLLGGVAAWLGFTLPSALLMLAFAQGVQVLEVGDAGWLHGLKVVAVAVVAQAVWGMARSLAPDRERVSVAVLAALVVLASRTAVSQVLVIVAAALNAAVVGLLLAALYDPVWSSAIKGATDFGLALVAFALLMFWRLPPWLVVAIGAAGGSIITFA